MFTEEVEPIPYESDYLEANTNPIRLYEDDLERLLSFIEPTYDNFEKGVCYLFNSPYEEEFIKDFVVRWYTQEDYNDAQLILDFCAAEFSSRFDNNWFFQIVDCIPQTQRNLILETYFNNTINESASIDISDPITFTSMKLNKDYRKQDGLGIRVGDFLTDLKKVAAYIDNLNMYIMKIKTSALKKAELKLMKPSEFKQKLREFKLGQKPARRKIKDITAWDVLATGSNMNYITVEEAVFWDTNPLSFNLFQGYEYNELNDGEEDYTVLQPFLDHVYSIICSQNEKIYEYIINWLSFIFQNPTDKTQVAIVLTGVEGTGKTTFTDVICRLLGTYANDNANIDEITGIFNSSILMKKLIVCNEVKSFTSSKSYDSDKMKTLITEKNIDINRKGKEAVRQENVANFIFVSNNFAPIKISEFDRRYLVIEVSPAKRGDIAYFTQLKDSFTDKFYANLLTFLLNNNIKNWNRTNIPMTSAKKEIIDFCKSQYQSFIQDYINKFKEGFGTRDAFTAYKKWCEENGYEREKINLFRLGVLKYCDNLQKPTRFRLKEDCHQFFDLEEHEEEEEKG
uniref:DUF5906 domain-containing protein n=1 Tax=Lactobacillus taiwanensis TaxID=508451 RepID=UPI002558134E|nr:DUF5906 domain-containing protein [Lactobacillus taiwanensis]